MTLQVTLCKTLTAVGFIGPLALLGDAGADDAVRTECYEAGEIIYVSPIADVELFNAEAYDVTLHQTIPLPAHNAVFYQFSPRDIYCLVVNE